MAKKDQNTSEKKNSGKEKKPGFFSRIGKWFHDLIVWPTRKQTANNTLIVIATILVIGVFIWILDAIFNLGITTLISVAA